MDASGNVIDPSSVLREQICPEVNELRLRNMSDLAVCPSFQGRLIWIDNIAAAGLVRWLSALLTYADACRNVEVIDRSVFLITLSGNTVVDVSSDDAALVRRDFRNVLDSLDLLVLALCDAPREVRRPAERALLAYTVSQVAQWDWLLAERLLAMPPDEALFPEDSLRQYAGIRGWSTDTSECWEQGTIDGPEGRPCVHSALLSITGRMRLVRQRIWAGQAAVLLPLVEERRGELIRQCRRYLRLPVESVDGLLIHDPFDLEVGQLTWHLDRENAPVSVRRRANELRRFRNMLAHMEPVVPDQTLRRFLVENQ